MKINKNVLKYTITGAFPFASFGLIFLLKVAQPGFKQVDDVFILDAIFQTAVMMSFFVPFLKIFEDKLKHGERIQNMMAQYKDCVAYIYENNYTKFKVWCQSVEIEKRRNAHMMLQLKRIEIEPSEYESRYHMQPKVIKNDPDLSKIQKKRLLRLSKELDRFESIDPDRALPGTEHTTVYNRLKSSLIRSERFEFIKKILLSALWIYGLSYITFKANFDAVGVEFWTEIAVMWSTGFWHIFMAYLAANRLINRTYFNELSEKKKIIDEFKEYQNK